MMDLDFKDLIEQLVEEFKNSVLDCEQELVEKLSEYLYLTVSTLKNTDSKFIGKDRDSIESVLRRITKNFISYDLDTKKQVLLPDESFDEIRKISNQVFEIAKDKLEGKKMVIDSNISKKVDHIKYLLSLVKKHNKEEAKFLLSETILDFEYICKSSTNIYSLRLGKIIETKL